MMYKTYQFGIMKRTLLQIFIPLLVVTFVSACSAQSKLPPKNEVLQVMQKTNAYFMNKWPDAGKTIITNKERASNIWTRAVYYEGLMSLYSVDKQKTYYDYAMQWGEKHNWGLNGGVQ